MLVSEALRTDILSERPPEQRLPTDPNISWPGRESHVQLQWQAY